MTIALDIRPWSDGDLPLLERLLGDPAMTVHLGGPETPEQIRERQERYARFSLTGPGCMFVVLIGPDKIPAGSVGYWEKEWQGAMVWESGWSVLPEFQGQRVAAKATALVIVKARAEKKHRYIHAFPSIHNTASNAICRKVGFTFQGEYDFEYPPGSFIRCNDWSLDLFAETDETRNENEGI